MTDLHDWRAIVWTVKVIESLCYRITTIDVTAYTTTTTIENDIEIHNIL